MNAYLKFTYCKLSRDIPLEELLLDRDRLILFKNLQAKTERNQQEDNEFLG